MNTIDCKKIHTAISTWSGFVYQGKVALYHVLKLLANNRNSDTYKLQLDSLEDFAILDTKNKPLTLHQVKALKSDLYSTYKEAFEKLEQRITTYPCDGAFFHYAVDIRDKTIVNIEKAHSKIKIYEYHDGKYRCKLDTIDSFIEDQIKLYFKNNAFNAKANPDYIAKTRNYLDELIQRQVIYIHSRIHKSLESENEAAYKRTILFEDFKNILDEDLNTKGTDVEYYLHLTRNDFNRYYQGFCFELGKISDVDKAKLKSYLTYVNALDDSEMVKFIRKIMPQREFKLNTISDYKDSNIKGEEIKDAFFCTLHEIQHSDNLETNSINWIDKSGNRYIPTTIDSGNRQKQKVCERIMKNVVNTDLDVVFECQKMITTDIDVDSVSDTAGNIIDVDESTNNSARITQWNKVSLISLDNAKDILNEDNN